MHAVDFMRQTSTLLISVFSQECTPTYVHPACTYISYMSNIPNTAAIVSCSVYSKPIRAQTEGHSDSRREIYTSRGRCDAAVFCGRLCWLDIWMAQTYLGLRQSFGWNRKPNQHLRGRPLPVPRKKRKSGVPHEAQRRAAPRDDLWVQQLLFSTYNSMH